MRTHSERIALAMQRQCYVAMLLVSVSLDAYQGGELSKTDTYPLGLTLPPLPAFSASENELGVMRPSDGREDPIKHEGGRDL
jgi:hypothetical protein